MLIITLSITLSTVRLILLVLEVTETFGGATTAEVWFDDTGSREGDPHSNFGEPEHNQSMLNLVWFLSNL